MTHSTLISGLTEVVGTENVLLDDGSRERYGRDWLKAYAPAPLCIVLPETIEEVQEIVRLCAREGTAIVPSGGRTGLSGGATATRGEVVVSLDRLNKIRSIDPIDRTVVAEAGVVTQRLQEEVAKHGLFLPIDFASKGSSQIGGNVATNAGGIRVVRWGMTREWVLGLKVVTPQGELLDLNGKLVKNQSGYDLRSLFIGSEGTLGIIVEITFKLTTPPTDALRLLCAVPSVENILEVFSRARNQFQFINAFEYFSRLGLEKVLSHHPLRDPFSDPHPAYLVVEIEPALSGGVQPIEEFFCSLLEDGTLSDVVISQNSKQADELLSYRELISETLSALHTIHKNDISVPIPAVATFSTELVETITREYPDFEVVIFGHVGDGNLHVNYLKPKEMTNDSFFEFCKRADHTLFSLVQRYKGSVSAEHGVGLLKKDYISYTRSEGEIALMKQIKRVFDPANIMNPGKVID